MLYFFKYNTLCIFLCLFNNRRLFENDLHYCLLMIYRRIRTGKTIYKSKAVYDNELRYKYNIQDGKNHNSPKKYNSGVINVESFINNLNSVKCKSPFWRNKEKWIDVSYRHSIISNKQQYFQITHKRLATYILYFL